MSITSSKLAQKYPDAAEKLEALYEEGWRLGSREGCQRLQLICEQYDQLSPNNAYLWLDPNAFQVEIEEAQLHRPLIEWLRFFRNIFSLAPLITTWFALFHAVGAYQDYLQTAGGAADKTSFLQLWEGGFNHATNFTFSLAAGLDVLFLLLYLVMILWGSELDRRAHAHAVAFTRKMQNQVNDILAYVAADGPTHISDQADIDRVVEAIRVVIDSSTDSVRQTMQDTKDTIKLLVDGTNETTKLSLNAIEQALKSSLSDMQTAVTLSIDTSTQSITASNTRVETIFTGQITPLLTEFHDDMKTLHTELGNYQGRLNDLTTASQEVATASKGLVQASQTLTDNAERYMSIGADIRAKIGELNSTQMDMVSKIQTVAGSISTAAENMTSSREDMTLAIHNIDKLAGTLVDSVQKIVSNLDRSVQTTVNAMTSGVNSSSASLMNLVPTLNETADTLSHTTNDLHQHLTPSLNSTTEALAQTAGALEQAANTLASIRLGTLLFGRRGRKNAVPTDGYAPAYPSRQRQAAPSTGPAPQQRPPAGYPSQQQAPATGPASQQRPPAGYPSQQYAQQSPAAPPQQHMPSNRSGKQ